MGNKFDEMREAVQEAEATFRAADSAARNMAELLCGRLPKVPTWILKRLKKELTRFNAHTGMWEP